MEAPIGIVIIRLALIFALVDRTGPAGFELDGKAGWDRQPG